MDRQSNLIFTSLNTTEMEEITAFVNFVEYFNKKFGESPSCHNFSITDLRTKLEQLATHKDNLLIFFLHHSYDEFSMNFCDFLQNPLIEAALRSDRHIFYCWDIQDDSLKPKLIQSFRNEIGDACADCIIQNKSVVLMIKSENAVPFICDFYDDAADLERLHFVLTGASLGHHLASHGEVEKEEIITPLHYQKLMATYLGARDYSSYEKTEHEFLKRNIGFALYGPPAEEGDKEYRPKDQRKDAEKDQQQNINKLFLQILKENNAFCKWNGRIVISFVYVCAEPLPGEKAERVRKYAKKNEKYVAGADFTPYPVFILRRCKHKGDPDKACRTIIDHEARVYKSWEAYLENNQLHACKMLYPKGGRYCSDQGVEFCSRLSPACDLSKKVVAVSDYAVAATGMAAGGVYLAAMTPALAAAPMIVPVAAVGSGIYAVGRNIYKLVDRKIHKQDVNLSDSESRAAYLNIAGGILSVGMFGAMRTVAFLAGRGVQFGEGARYVLYSINGVNITVNGIGIGNNIYEAYRTRNVSPFLIAQIGASILFFGNALYNMKTIANIIEESQANTLNEIESSLNINKVRGMFGKLLKGQIGKMDGETLGKTSVISSIHDVENVDEVIATLAVLNNYGIQFTAQDDKIHLNGIPIDVTNFGSINRIDQVSSFERFPPIPENLSANNLVTITENVLGWLGGLETLRRLATSLTLDQLVKEFFSGFEPFVRDYVMDISKRFFNRLDPAVVNRLSQVTSDTIVKLMHWVVNQLIDKATFKRILNYEHISSREINNVVDDLEGEFQCQYVNYEYDVAKREERKKQRRTGIKKVRKTCGTCSGYYYK